MARREDFFQDSRPSMTNAERNRELGRELSGTLVDCTIEKIERQANGWAIVYDDGLPE